MNEWQPIETAPKDGGEILGWREDCGILLMRWTCVGEFLSDKEIEDGDYSEESIWEQDWFCADFVYGLRLEGNEIPTHWMPLPEPPK